MAIMNVTYKYTLLHRSLDNKIVTVQCHYIHKVMQGQSQTT